MKRPALIITGLMTVAALAMPAGCGSFSGMASSGGGTGQESVADGISTETPLSESASEEASSAGTDYDNASGSESSEETLSDGDGTGEDLQESSSEALPQGATQTLMVDASSLAGCFEYEGCFAYISDEGIVVTISAEKSPDVPAVSGLEYETLRAGYVLESQMSGNYDSLGEITEFLRGNYISWDGQDVRLLDIMKEAAISSDCSITLNFGDVYVSLGQPENLFRKLSEMKDILPSLYGLEGTLYLDSAGQADEGGYAFR